MLRGAAFAAASGRCCPRVTAAKLTQQPPPAARSLLLLSPNRRCCSKTVQHHGQQQQQHRSFSTITAVQQQQQQPPIHYRIRSRRVWRRNHPPPSAAAIAAESSKKAGQDQAKTDALPWPKSVLYTGMVVGCIAVPYTILFILATFPSLRESVLTKSQLDTLREWYGTENPHEISYPDQVALLTHHQQQPLPRLLPGELPTHRRKQQEHIETFVISAAETVRAKLIPFDQDDTILTSLEKTVDLPASTWARLSDLKPFLMQGNESGNVDVSRVVRIALDFQLETDHTKEELLFSSDNSPSSSSLVFDTPNDNDGVITFDSQEERSSSSSLSSSSSIIEEGEKKKKKSDPLVNKTAIYSTWYYQSTAPSHNQTHVASTITNGELQIQQLEADLIRLQAELTNPYRSVDDVQDEIQATKRMLRRLKWNKWLPWNR